MANTLAYQLFSLRAFEGGWDAAFDAVRQLGIETIEPWCGAVPADPDSGMSIDSLRSSIERAGLSLTCGHMTVAEYDANYEQWRDFLLDYGSRHWVIPFAKADSLGEWLSLVPKFREMAEQLEADGLSLGYHNHHMELEKAGDKYIMEHLLDAMPELQAQFHIGQFRPERGISLPDWIRTYEGRVCSLHVNDTNEDGPTRLGEGTCGVEDAIKAALDTGVDTFIIEVNLTEGNIDDVLLDVEFTRRLIA